MESARFLTLSLYLIYPFFEWRLLFSQARSMQRGRRIREGEMELLYSVGGGGMKKTEGSHFATYAWIMSYVTFRMAMLCIHVQICQIRSQNLYSLYLTPNKSFFFHIRVPKLISVKISIDIERRAIKTSRTINIKIDRCF